MKNYYVAVLVNGPTMFGSMKSIQRISNGTKRSIRDKAPACSIEGECMFNLARRRS